MGIGFLKCIKQLDGFNMFQVSADSVRALYKRKLKLDIEYKKLKIEKIKLELEQLRHDKMVSDSFNEQGEMSSYTSDG